MKRFYLLHTNLGAFAFTTSRSFAVITALSIIFCGCGDPKRPPTTGKSKQSILLVIGEDLSQTFNKNNWISTDVLNNICQAIDNSGCGGKVVLLGIGNSTPTGYITCILKPFNSIDKTSTVREQIMVKQANDKIKMENKRQVQQFLEQSEKLLAKRNQPYTDINGFMEKVGVLVQSPGAEDYQKWVYINSDGRQSTKTTNAVNCDLVPSLDFFCISGWKNKVDCNATGKFLDPGAFYDYFKSMVARAK